MIGIATLCLLGIGLIGTGAWLSGAAVLGRSAEQLETREAASEPGDTAGSAAGGETEAEEEGSGSDPALPRTAVRADPAWVARVSGQANIPERALAAYASAALTLGRENPGCGLGWNTLAAIGHVESAHGTLNGAVLDPSGMALPRILGVPLDGARFAAVHDTDGGRLDGDAQWDRAVGPMQFLPQTWAVYARDGNNDGLMQVDQIDDAALAAATMLCSSGGNLGIPADWVVAVHAYNPSVAYNNAVADVAEYYAGFS